MNYFWIASCVRASIYLYNNESDIIRITGELEEVILRVFFRLDF